jgi:hypothetical protein
MAVSRLSSFLDIISLKFCIKNSYYECVLPTNVVCTITVIVTNKVWFNDKFRNFKPKNILYFYFISPLF